MPPTPTASNSKPGAKGAGKGLGKKVGPFSLWVWLVMAAGAAVVAYLYMRNRSAGDGGGAFVETVTGNQTASPMEQAYGGGSVGNENLTGQVDPATLSAMIDQQIQPFLASAGDLRGHVYEMEDALKNYGWSINEDKTWSPPMTSGEAVADATLGPPGGGPSQGQPQAAAGVRWGGQTFTTKKGLANYLAGSQGRGRAESYRDWATKHPGAARSLAGPAPKPQPKKQPARTAPKAKAPAKPKKQPPKKQPPKKVAAKAKVPARRGGR